METSPEDDPAATQRAVATATAALGALQWPFGPSGVESAPTSAVRDHLPWDTAPPTRHVVLLGATEEVSPAFWVFLRSCARAHGAAAGADGAVLGCALGLPLQPVDAAAVDGAARALVLPDVGAAAGLLLFADRLLAFEAWCVWGLRGWEWHASGLLDQS